MSFSAHKTYGPKGVGALFVRRKPRVRIEAQMHGGGHERGMRSGTLPTHQIVGMGEAFRIAKQEMATENERIRMLRDRLWKGLSEIEEVYLNGDLDARVPHNLNVSFNYRRGREPDHGGQGHRGVVRARRARRRRSSRRTCCARSAAATSWRTARSASRSAASRPRPTSTTRSTCSSARSRSCASCRRCGKCTRTAIDISSIQWAAH